MKSYIFLFENVHQIFCCKHYISGKTTQTTTVSRVDFFQRVLCTKFAGRWGFTFACCPRITLADYFPRSLERGVSLRPLVLPFMVPVFSDEHVRALRKPPIAIESLENTALLDSHHTFLRVAEQISDSAIPARSNLSSWFGVSGKKCACVVFFFKRC